MRKEALCATFPILDASVSDFWMSALFPEISHNLKIFAFFLGQVMSGARMERGLSSCKLWLGFVTTQTLLDDCSPIE
jgi:hypothetical protein